MLTFAHSPDPDDAYMFYGFAAGAVKIPGHEVKHHLEDIQTLNERALRGEFEITAVSAHAYAHLADKYWALSCGASVGRKYGPILVERKASSVNHTLHAPRSVLLSRENGQRQPWCSIYGWLKKNGRSKK